MKYNVNHQRITEISKEKNDVITLWNKILKGLAMRTMNYRLSFMVQPQRTSIWRHRLIIINKTFLCRIFPCCIFSVVIFVLCCIKRTSLSAKKSSNIYLAYFWSGSKEDFFSRSWSIRTDSLSCDFSVCISKLCGCNKVELSAPFIAAFNIF